MKEEYKLNSILFNGYHEIVYSYKENQQTRLLDILMIEMSLISSILVIEWVIKSFDSTLSSHSVNEVYMSMTQWIIEISSQDSSYVLISLDIRIDCLPSFTDFP